MISEISCFFNTFQMAIGHHVEFLKTKNFICRHGLEDRCTSLTKFSGNWFIVADILRFFKLSKWLLPPPSCIFEIAKFYWLILTKSLKNTSIFTARGYAKRGICRRRVSVCVCVSVSYLRSELT